MSEPVVEEMRSPAVGDEFRGRFVFGEDLTMGGPASMLDWEGHSQVGSS